MNIVTELQKKDHAGWWNPELHLLAMFIHGIMPTINTVVEIGVQTGGSADVWLKFVPADGMYVGIDINLHDPKQGLYAQMDEVKKRFAPDKRVNFLIADSTKQTTLKSAVGILNQRPVDFLFIDGYHSTEAALSDYRMYAPLVRSGGIIAIHDATSNLNVKQAIDEIVDIYYLNADGSAGQLPPHPGKTGQPFSHVVRIDSKERHCGIIALVKE